MSIWHHQWRKKRLLSFSPISILYTPTTSWQVSSYAKLYRFFNLNFIKCKERLLPWRWISKSSKEKSQNTACSVILMSPVIIYTTLIQWLRPTEQSQFFYWYASKHPTLKVASEWMHTYWNVNFLRRSSHGHKKQAVVFAWILILIVLWW